MEQISKFKQYVDGLKDDRDVNLIESLMCHKKVADAHLLLCLINDIIVYYTNRPEDGTLRFPLLYIPASEPWAQQVCIEFVTLKLALLYYKNSFQSSPSQINLPQKCNKKRHEHLRKFYQYRKKIARAIGELELSPRNNRKNLIISRPFDQSAPDNPFLQDLCGPWQAFADSTKGVSCADITVDRLEKAYRNYKEGDCGIENIFVFLSRSTNGHFAESSFSFQPPKIENLNRKGVGIRNVFYFYFSTRPYKLQRLYDWKQNKATRILHGRNIRAIQDFISLTPRESDAIFGRTSRQENWIIEIPEGVEEFKVLADNALEDCEYGVQVRNDLAVCWNEELQNLFWTQFKDKQESRSSNLEILINYISACWAHNILPRIQSFMGDKTDAALIMDYFMPDVFKQQIITLFKNNGINVTIHDFSGLKYSQDGTTYQPNSLADRIIVLSYQGHYVGLPYHRYPNSFDPMYLRPDQRLLNVINRMALDPYYAVHRYKYQLALRDVLTSDYRTSRLGCPIILPEQPRYRIEDSADRSTSRGDNPNQGYQRYRARVKGQRRGVSLTETDYVICRHDDSVHIMTGLELFQFMQESQTCCEIIPMSDFQDKLEDFLERGDTTIRKNELSIRQLPKYHLTDSEINSEAELWRILLCKRVAQNGEDLVYKELMANMPETGPRGKDVFERWYNLEYTMILPRNICTQSVLFKYLDIDPPYDRIIRRKKARRVTQERQKNSMLRSFLCNNLLSDDFEASFVKLSDTVRDMLYIDSADDLKALVETLWEDLTYVTIDRMQQTR